MIELLLALAIGMAFGYLLKKEQQPPVIEILQNQVELYEEKIDYYKKLCLSHVEDKEKIKLQLRQIKGLEQPFICGGSGEKDSLGMTEVIFICPAMGADGFAIYKMTTPYSAPGY